MIDPRQFVNGRGHSYIVPACHGMRAYDFSRAWLGRYLVLAVQHFPIGRAQIEVERGKTRSRNAVFSEEFRLWHRAGSWDILSYVSRGYRPHYIARHSPTSFERLEEVLQTLRDRAGSSSPHS